jgi:chemotaxis protein methyltransferase CheR
MMAATAQALRADDTREFHFTDAHFNQLRKLVTRHAGIQLNDSKRQLVYSRLMRRIRALGLSGFDEYCELVAREDSGEIEDFVNAITTNLTSFFRENHHFEFLAHSALPAWQRANARSRRLRLWSAGCSTGEEPYSIAMTVLDALGANHGWDVKVLATDIDSSVLAQAASAVYAANRQQGIGEARLRRWFTTSGCAQGEARAKDELRDIIRFAPLNLLGEWPFAGPFDGIFCRNVVIYFDKPTQGRLFNRYADKLAPHGNLFIGHSESMFGTCTRFDLIGRTIYRLANGATA